MNLSCAIRNVRRVEGQFLILCYCTYQFHRYRSMRRVWRSTDQALRGFVTSPPLWEHPTDSWIRRQNVTKMQITSSQPLHKAYKTKHKIMHITHIIYNTYSNTSASKKFLLETLARFLLQIKFLCPSSPIRRPNWKESWNKNLKAKVWLWIIYSAYI